MKQILVTLTIILTLSYRGHSQELAKKEKIKQLFSIMQQDSLMIKTIDGMTASQVKNMAVIFKDTSYTNNGVDVSAMMKRLAERSMQKSKEMALRLLNEDMVDIYDKYFTVEEIDDFIAFYKSKAGRKMLTQMPDITREVMTIMAAKYQPDLQQSFMKDMQEITEQAKANRN